MDLKRKIKGFAAKTGQYIKKGGKAIGKGAKKIATKTKDVVTSPSFKRKIKGFAKTVGKYSLKGAGKGVELSLRGSSKIIGAIVKNPTLQKIGTTAGMIAASVYIPQVGAIIVGTIGLKYLIDRPLLGKRDKNLIGEVKDIINLGNTVTKTVGNKILGPICKKVNESSKNLGTKYQDAIDSRFV